MKKIVLCLLALVITFSFVGCANQQSSAETNLNTDPPVQEIQLTIDNINEYLSFSYNVVDVEISSTMSYFFSAEGTATLKTSPLKQGSFENVILQVVLQPDESVNGWSSTEKEISIPLDGKFEESFTAKGSSAVTGISKNPTFSVVVKSVSGKIVMG